MFIGWSITFHTETLWGHPFSTSSLPGGGGSVEEPKQKKKSVSFSSDKAQTFYWLISPEQLLLKELQMMVINIF